MSFAESQVLNKVLATGDMSIISNNGITEDVFHTYKDEFRYIWDVYREYGCPPDKASFIAKFPNFDLFNEEDAKSVTCGSNKKILCKCPTCSCLKEMSVHNLVNYGFSCPVCSDGISYPNKFMRKFLSQLDIDFISEKSFSWSDGRLYDIFIPSINIIIENHGIQHYSEINGIFNDLEYEKRNDKYKRNLALDNNIEHYIEIDCRKSDKDFIKNSIMNSQLPKLLNFCEKDIDWEECDLFSNTPFLESICKTWNNNKNITDVCNELNLNCSTVRKYLQIGAKYGLCDYDPKLQMKRSGKRNIYKACFSNSIKIICTTTGEIFNSIADAYRWLGYNPDGHTIQDNCKGKQKTAGKHPITKERLSWMFYDEYLKLEGSS